MPIISPISGDASGNSYNVNADTAAAAIALAARCTDLVYFTDVPGVKVEGNILADLNLNQAQELITDGVIKEGMVAKMESVFEALRGIVQRIHSTQGHGDDTLQELVARKSNSGTIIHL